MDKNILSQYSNDVGIDILAVTDSNPLDRLYEYLKLRIESGFKTEFEENDINKRTDPKLTLKNCKSIIVVGISYNVDFENQNDIKITGSLSKSSWGEDYHKVLKDKLQQLADKIIETEQMEYKVFVDTGPLVDRELAYKAGIGYYGKNCSIINPYLGSFIFLGYILTDLEIEKDIGEIESQCGECRLCLDACPTGALYSPFKLDTKRCISYLTQTKDPISEELSTKMGINIYGCDTCQRVCPKNNQVVKNLHPEFIPTKTNGRIDIEELIFMSKNEFRHKYGSMSGSWRGKTVLIRNSLIALININKKEHEYLIKEIEKKKISLFQEYIKRWKY